SNLADVAGSPIIDRGVVYAVSHAGQMSAIDVRSGQSIWENGISSIQMPWIADDFLFVVTIENELVALAREDGAVAWIKQLPKYEKQKKKKKRISWSGPVAAGGKLLLVSTKGQLAVVSPADGSIERQVKIGKSSMIAPIIAEETVFVLNDKGNLVAFK
ncbi:MAG: PQQ-binding-like beta-propeller repeat protein, partial [Parvularculaceae bacterium]